MSPFDAIVAELAKRFGLGSKALPFVQELLRWIIGQPAGFGGFLERFGGAGAGGLVKSWLGRADAPALPDSDVTSMFSQGLVDQFARKFGLEQAPAAAAIGWALPKLIGLLSPGGVIPTALPPAVTAFIGTPSATAAAATVPAAAVPPPVGAAPPLPPPAPARKGAGWLLPLVILAALVGGLWYWFMGRSPAPPPPAPPVASQNPVPVTPPPATPPPPPQASAPPPPSQAVVPPPPVTPAPSADVTPPAPSATAPSTAPSRAVPRAQPTFSFENLNGKATVSGRVNDEASRSSIMDALRGVFGAGNVSGDVTVDPSVGSASWLSHLRDALAQFKLPGLRALFDGSAIAVGGSISGADRDRVLDSLKSLFGSDFTFSTAAGSATPAANAPASAAQGGGNTAVDVAKALSAATINFETGRAELSDEDRSTLRDAASRLKSLPSGTVIEISGHTDNTGDQAANVELSNQRANAVREFLVQSGVSADMLVAKGYGSTQPIASNDTEEGRAQNRRIEYRVLK